MKRTTLIKRWKAALALALGHLLPASVAAQSTTGTIEGRVSNSARGENVERARVTVEGTLLEAFCQDDGSYRLTNVPAGTTTVRTFFSGFPVHTRAVSVVSGQRVRHDVDLAATKGADAARDAEIVKLSEFLVSTSRDMDAAAIAINAQRFAPNIKSVVSTDEFGNVAEGSGGEFLKFLPGKLGCYPFFTGERIYGHYQLWKMPTTAEWTRSPQR